jgi:hypothetical protein
MSDRSFITLCVLLAITMLGCAMPRPSIVGKWSGLMTVKCSHPLPPTYRPLSISLDLTADGQCTNVHGSGIGADITSHDSYQLRDSLLLVTSFWGTDTLKVATLTETELVLRRMEQDTACVHFFTMTREAPVGTTP